MLQFDYNTKKGKYYKSIYLFCVIGNFLELSRIQNITIVMICDLTKKIREHNI